MGTTSAPSDQTTTEQPHEPHDYWADHWAEPHERCVRCLRPAVDEFGDVDLTTLIGVDALRETWRSATFAPYPEDGQPGVCEGDGSHGSCVTREEREMVEAIDLRRLLEMSRARDDLSRAALGYTRTSLLRHLVGAGDNREVLAMIDARKLHRMAEAELEQIELDLTSEGPGPAILSVVAPVR